MGDGSQSRLTTYYRGCPDIEGQGLNILCNSPLQILGFVRFEAVSISSHNFIRLDRVTLRVPAIMSLEIAEDKQITREEVAQNNTEDSLWCIVDHRVYDMTDFQEAHPGGNVVLLQIAGQDATSAFYKYARPKSLATRGRYK